jgi:hypothetical protein
MEIPMPKTVGELRELLCAFKDSIPVVMENHHGDCHAIRSVKVRRVGADLRVVFVENYKV